MDQNDTELEARFDDLYQQIMAGYDSLPLATWTAEYRAAIRELRALEVQFRVLGVELARRHYERTAAWNETMDAALKDITEAASDE